MTTYEVYETGKPGKIIETHTADDFAANGAIITRKV
jgi:hypothetical protein